MNKTMLLGKRRIERKPKGNFASLHPKDRSADSFHRVLLIKAVCHALFKVRVCRFEIAWLSFHDYTYTTLRAVLLAENSPGVKA
jgi:hypothetical protein